MRRLSAEEAQLWGRVTATIRPLSRDVPTPPAPPPAAPRAATPPPPPPPGPQPARVKIPPLIRRAAPPPPSPRPGTTLDGSWDRKLTTGRIVPDRTLDLHGHNLDSAWTAIDRALDDAISSGDRVLLLVTGHQRRGEPPIERGRIRAAVHDWLAASRHARRIAAVRNAHPRHGGGGSLYLILRKPPPGSTLS